MFHWIRKGLATGIVTTGYPAKPDPMPANFRGKPVLNASYCAAGKGCSACVNVCLPGALRLDQAESGEASPRLTLDTSRCIMCGLCVTACPAGALTMSNDFELASRNREDLLTIVKEG